MQSRETTPSLEEHKNRSIGLYLYSEWQRPNPNEPLWSLILHARQHIWDPWKNTRRRAKDHHIGTYMTTFGVRVLSVC